MNEIEFVWFLPEAGHCVVPVPASHSPGASAGAPDNAVLTVVDEAQIAELLIERERLALSLNKSRGVTQAPNPKSQLSGWIRPVGSASGSINSWRRYAPLRDNTALFRTFADLEYKRECFVDFANRFGLLTDPENGEPIATWETALSDMRSAVECWEKSKWGVSGIAGTGESRAVADVLARPATQVNPGADIDAKPQLARGRYNVFAAYAYGDRRHFVDFLARMINQNISHVRTVFTSNSDAASDGLALRLVPTTLLEAMWLQFGQVVESNESYRKCRQCGTWFALSKAARIDKVFCTEACKARAYRRRVAGRDQGIVNLRLPDVKGHEIEDE